MGSEQMPLLMLLIDPILNQYSINMAEASGNEVNKCESTSSGLHVVICPEYENSSIFI